MMDAPSTPPVLAASQPPKLLDSLRQRIRVLHYSIRTEQAYVDWVRRFILFHGKRHTRDGCAGGHRLSHASGWRAQCVRLHAMAGCQELPGHEDVTTTMIYPHVLNKGGRGVPSPLDAL
jgi:integrase